MPKIMLKVIDSVNIGMVAPLQKSVLHTHAWFVECDLP